MGLGKTIQTLVFLETTKKAMGDRATAGGQAAAAANPIFLIVVPLSTLANWQRETKEVSRGSQLQCLWRIPTAAVS